VDEAGNELVTFTPQPEPMTLLQKLMMTPPAVRHSAKIVSYNYTKKVKEQPKKARKQSAKSRKINRGK
jgi:hypothetical protein